MNEADGARGTVSPQDRMLLSRERKNSWKKSSIKFGYIERKNILREI